MDDKDVQEGTVSEDGEVSTPEPQPFTTEQEARLTEIVQNATSQGGEQGKRDMQGKKDAEISRLQRRFQTQDQTYANLDTQDLDPEVRQTLQNARTQAQLQYYQMQEAENVKVQQTSAFDKSFHDSMSQAITSMGLDPNSKEIDWADDTGPDYLEKQKRILSSVSKIQANEKKESEARSDQKLKDEIASIRKELNLDTVETSDATSTGGDFKKKWASGELPPTKENLKKAREMMGT